MTNETEMPAAVQQFVADMTAAGAPAHLDEARVLYDVRAVGGPLAGQIIPTGVCVSEIQSWPAVPPHWIHLPSWVTFPETNSDSTDCLPGWLRHSRDYQYTDTSQPPALSWLRHVRGLLSIATALAA